MQLFVSFGAFGPREFFRRNYFTAGLELLVKRGFDRLAGTSDDGAFCLTQAMGGGKTHSLIALGFLAANPELRKRFFPSPLWIVTLVPPKSLFSTAIKTPTVWSGATSRRSLTGKPRTGTLYSDKMAILPALDEIKLDDDRPTLVILERPADKLPQDFDDWWHRQDLQNRVLVLTADPNAVKTLRDGARRMRAIEKVEERIKAQHGQASPQMEELQSVKGRETAGFTSALRETFKTIVFPTGRALRKVGDFHMEFERNEYSGEQQIIDTLTKWQVHPERKVRRKIRDVAPRCAGNTFRRRRGSAILSSPQCCGPLRLVLAAAQWSRSARQVSHPAWLLAREGRPHCQEMGTPHQSNCASRRLRAEPHRNRPLPDQRDARRCGYRLCLRGRAPNSATSARLDGRVYETAAAAAWFLAIDSQGVAKTGEACEWRAPIRVKPDVRRVSGGYRVSFIASPRSAKIRATFDGSDPKLGPVINSGDIEAPLGATRLRAVAEADSQFGAPPGTSSPNPKALSRKAISCKAQSASCSASGSGTRTLGAWRSRPRSRTPCAKSSTG